MKAIGETKVDFKLIMEGGTRTGGNGRLAHTSVIPVAPCYAPRSKSDVYTRDIASTAAILRSALQKK